MVIDIGRKLMEVGAFAGISVGLFLFGFSQGFNVGSFTLSLFSVVIEVFWMEALLSSLSFMGFIAFSSLIFFYKSYRSKINQETESYPEITCIIPNYYDGVVVSRAVESILDSDYPDFDICVVSSRKDEKSRDVLEKYENRGNFRHLLKDEDKCSKAENINYALSKTDSDAVAIFDADQVVDTKFLRNAASYLQDYGVVQGRHLPISKSLPGEMAYYESVIFVYITRQLSYILTSFRLAGSNTVVIKRDVFEKIGRYDDKVLTEDFDFSHRCYKNGIKVRNILLPVTQTVAAGNFRDWWGQRKRWMKGYFQVLAKLIRKTVYEFRGYKSILSLLIASGSLLGSFFMLVLVSKFIVLFLTASEIIYLSPIVLISAISLSCRINDFRKNRVNNIGKGWVFTPLMFPLFSLATIKAFTEVIIQDRVIWYKVDKT